MSMILNGKKSLLNVTFIGGGGVKEPEKTWFFPVEYSADGYVTKAKSIGMTGEMPNYLYQVATDTSFGARCPILNEIKEFEINDGVTSIGNYAFASHYKLEKVIIPNSVTSMGVSVFERCNILKEMTLLNVTTLSPSVFSECKVLESVSMPNVTTMGHRVFYNCQKLKKINETNEINATSVSSYAFQNCYALKSVSFPNATSVGEYAFITCRALTSISLPNATSIGGNAFAHCTALESVTLPSATSLGTYSFASCTSLKSITLPNATSIGNYAFSGSNGFTLLVLGANQVCTISSTNSIPASSTKHITIKVPSDLIESYKTATNWSTHYNNGYITFEAIA